MEMTRLIIVCGLSGSGKTTLAKELSKKLNIFCLHKDLIKESLAELLKISTFEESKKMGIISVGLLFALAEEQLSNGLSLMIEAPFNFEEDFALFKKWEKKYALEIIKLVCEIEERERLERYRKRLPERHPCHYDEQRILEGELSFSKKDVYQKMPGKEILVVTNKPVGELVEYVLNKIN